MQKETAATVVPSLKECKLTPSQELWLKYVYDNGGKMEQVEAYRALGDKLPGDFDAYKDLAHFWNHDCLNIFGIYKINPDDKVLVTLDAILVALRDVFAKENGRKAVSMSEFANVCQKPAEDIKAIFDGSHFYEFWLDNSSSFERVDYNHKTNEREFQISDYRALKRIKNYKDFESQIEFRWQKETGRIGGLQAIDIPSELRPAISDSWLASTGLDYLGSNQSPQIKTHVDLSDDTPDFSAVVDDSAMNALLSRRWEECKKCIDADAPLAAIVMMGGLLEALFVAKAQAMRDKEPLFRSASTPKDNATGNPLPLREWKLKSYLDVGHELGWIARSAKEVGAVLRDYRNYVHPDKEHAHGVVLGIDDCRMLWQVTKELVRQLGINRA